MCDLLVEESISFGVSFRETRVEEAEYFHSAATQGISSVIHRGRNHESFIPHLRKIPTGFKSSARCECFSRLIHKIIQAIQACILTLSPDASCHIPGTLHLAPLPARAEDLASFSFLAWSQALPLPPAFASLCALFSSFKVLAFSLGSITTNSSSAFFL